MSDKANRTIAMPKDAKPAEVRQIYKDFAVTYDEELVPESTYPALLSIINTFVEVIGSSDKSIRIIDLGAGTGLAAVELKKHGFTNIDGLDLSPEMLKKAKDKDAYRKYICEAVTEKRLDIPSGAYDVALSVGAVTSGYIKASAFDEILRLTKPGGFIIFTIRKDALDDDECGFSAKFQKFISEGKWQEVKKYLSDYLADYEKYKDGSKLAKCYVVVYKVLKNE